MSTGRFRERPVFGDGIKAELFEIVIDIRGAVPWISRGCIDCGLGCRARRMANDVFKTCRARGSGIDLPDRESHSISGVARVC